MRNRNEQARTVLLVQDDADERGRTGRWLEEAGYHVEVCPGPTAPGYTCLGSREARCPLVDIADAVVLDLRLAPDVALQGTPAWHLLLFYLDNLRPVIVLADDDDPVRPTEGEGVTVLRRRDLERDELLRAVREALTQEVRS